MPEIDLSQRIPPEAQWVKIRYQMTPKKDGAELISRIWSGSLDEAKVIKGPEGDVFVKLDTPQKINYQRPVTIDLKLKVVAYKIVK